MALIIFLSSFELSEFQFLVKGIHKSDIPCGQLYPSGTEAAFDSVSCRTQVAPSGAIKMTVAVNSGLTEGDIPYSLFVMEFFFQFVISLILPYFRHFFNGNFKEW
ncbi:MAG: hypothetical protein IJW00_06320 [Clostridia bacterium]|nr:hypothetical protein [Clostridia bacterium]